MPIVPISTIKIKEDRVRREFSQDRVEMLKRSILSTGLLHPISVDQNGFIVVGETRFKAISLLAQEKQSFFFGGKMIATGEIPVEQYHSLNEVDLLAAELDENLQRTDLTWQEKAAGTEKLFRLRGLQREARGEETRFPELELAKELAKSGDLQIAGQAKMVKENLILAAWKDDDEVQKAPTKKDALKIIEAKLMKGHREALAREFKLKENALTRHTLIHGNAVLELPKLPSDHFDCIITDPPYGVNIDKYADLQGGVDHHYDDSPAVLRELLLCFQEEFFRVTKEKAHLYMFCDFQFFDLAKNTFALGGWDVWPRPLIWHRSDSTGMLPRAKHGPRRNYECILYAIKGNKEVNIVANDVLSFPSERGATTAARKPVALLSELMKRSCHPGSFVLDPCCGSGPIFEAGKEHEVVVTGIELNEALFGLCSEVVRRLGDA